MDPLFEAQQPARVGGVSVTFEPGARTAWHSHPLGQTLIVTAGCGWVQRWGGPVEEIRPGDVVSIPPGEKHVSGKGMGAALLMSSTRTVLRLVAMTGLPPGEVLSRVNRLLVHDFPATKFVTLVYVVLDPREGTLVFANAGHPPPVLVSSRGVSVLESEAGIPLGIEESTFSEQRMSMAPDDRLLLYSDGVTEAMNAELQLYGENRLRERAPGASVADLLEDVRAFSGGQSPNDDITLVLIRRRS